LQKKLDFFSSLFSNACPQLKETNDDQNFSLNCQVKPFISFNKIIFMFDDFFVKSYLIWSNYIKVTNQIIIWYNFIKISLEIIYLYPKQTLMLLVPFTKGLIKAFLTSLRLLGDIYDTTNPLCICWNQFFNIKKFRFYFSQHFMFEFWDLKSILSKVKNFWFTLNLSHILSTYREVSIKT
jgi:hypothetical protein